MKDMIKKNLNRSSLNMRKCSWRQKFKLLTHIALLVQKTIMASYYDVIDLCLPELQFSSAATGCDFNVKVAVAPGTDCEA